MTQDIILASTNCGLEVVYSVCNRLTEKKAHIVPSGGAQKLCYFAFIREYNSDCEQERVDIKSFIIMRRSQRPVKLPTWRKDQEEESATMTPKPKKSTFDRRNDNNSEFQEISRSPQTKSTGKKSTGGRSNSSKRPNTKKSTAANPSASSSTSPKSPLGETHSNSYENYDYDAVRDQVDFGHLLMGFI